MNAKTRKYLIFGIVTVAALIGGYYTIKAIRTAKLQKQLDDLNSKGGTDYSGLAEPPDLTRDGAKTGIELITSSKKKTT